MQKQKRVAAIHDLSGFGKCSLTVALPILSCAGIEACALPTAFLSTHTGGLGRCHYHDLTEDLLPTVEHWMRLNLSFDAVYSGFLGSYEQISIVSDIMDRFRTEQNLIAIDPVMGDFGSLYSTYTPRMAEGMIRLCRKADLITPNMTEAAFLLGREYHEGPYTRSEIEETLFSLSKLGPGQVVLTGVWFSSELLGAAGYCSESGTVSYALAPCVKGLYHGTGDIFASVLVSALLCGRRLNDAMQIAVDFTHASIRNTHYAGTDPRFGVNFEAQLLQLSQELNPGSGFYR